ncbi:MAG TPA: UDP-N-acetylmuramoyl-tripeptide--D-alanyl-D-alanine ligase, partial [Armatimonadota bacterium]|nr:UDP-N-acetylmuramoyl-tripeptide--D-alanyl-D-alanine ligase [Armatimonadota bacterium]
MTYKLRDVVTAIGGELIKGDPVVEIKGISTDTRTIAPGDLFFALIGENSDGHEYVQTAVEKGAAAVVVSKQVDTDSAIILVPDTLIALGDLAALHRRQFRVRVVGITGSVGKTSTKEMVAAVLSSRYNVLKNAGNFNNEIGVPLTIFQLKPEHEILVQEMAMRLPGEIAELTEIAKPDIGVITNIGVSHIERLGTRDNIAAAKAELLESLSIDGIAVLNADDPYFDFLSGKTAAGVVSYGISSGNVQASNIRIDSMGRPSFKVKVGKSEFDVILPLPGEHNVPNALAAIAVGLCFGIPVKESTAALASMVAADKRANVF